MATLLVIEDSRIQRRMLKNTLVAMGYTVDEAENGRLGLEMIGRGSYAVVFCDILMPEMDGVSMIEEVRAQGLEIPIVMLSSNIQKGVRARLEELGVREFVNKPFTEENLAQSLKAVQS